MNLIHLATSTPPSKPPQTGSPSDFLQLLMQLVLRYLSTGKDASPSQQSPAPEQSQKKTAQLPDHRPSSIKSPAATSRKTQPSAPVFLRPTRYTSRYYYSFAVKLWNWLLLSLPLDLALLLLDVRPGRHIESVSALTTAIVFLLIVSLVFFFHDRCIDLVLGWGSAQSRLTRISARYSFLVLAILGLAVFVEVASKMGGVDVVSVIFAVIVTLGAVRSIRRSLEERRLHHAQLERDRMLWVEETNRKIFFLAMAPVLSARLISPLGGLLALMSSGSISLFLAYIGMSGLFMLMAMPRERLFIMTCKSCGINTSVILRKTGLCPNCEARRASAKEQTTDSASLESSSLVKDRLGEALGTLKAAGKKKLSTLIEGALEQRKRANSSDPQEKFRETRRKDLPAKSKHPYADPAQQRRAPPPSID